MRQRSVVRMIAASVALLAFTACQTITAPLPPTSTEFYAITRGEGGVTSELYYMDEFGTATLVGDTGVVLRSIKADPTDGTMYGMVWDGGGTNPALVPIDLETGAAGTGVPLSVDGARRAFAFLGDGTLIAHNGDTDDFEVIDVTTGNVTVLGPNTEISWYAYGMWVDDDDVLWFNNGDGNVYTIDTSDGSQTLVHEFDDWVGVYEDAALAPWGDVILQGDFNRDTGELWGVSHGYNYIPASAIVRAKIDADGAELIGTAPAQSAIAIRSLAFPR